MGAIGGKFLDSHNPTLKSAGSTKKTTGYTTEVLKGMTPEQRKAWHKAYDKKSMHGRSLA